MFNERNVNFIDSVSTWEESIKIAAKPLIEGKNIEENYITSMIENINELGFYIVLDTYVAMPHSRPECGVNKTGISFLKVNNSVMYGDSEIKLIFVLAASDADTHIDKLKELLDLLQDENKKEALLKAKNKEELIKILN